MKVEIKVPIVMFYDNTSAINISKNLVMHSKTKHIGIKVSLCQRIGVGQGNQIEICPYKGTNC